MSLASPYKLHKYWSTRIFSGPKDPAFQARPYCTFFVKKKGLPNTWWVTITWLFTPISCLLEPFVPINRIPRPRVSNTILSFKIHFSIWFIFQYVGWPFIAVTNQWNFKVRNSRYQLEDVHWRRVKSLNSLISVLHDFDVGKVARIHKTYTVKKFVLMTNIYFNI